MRHGSGSSTCSVVHRGLPPYGDLRSRARLIRTDDFGVRIAHADDLIAMKRAAGRAKDLADIEELEAIAEVRRWPYSHCAS